MSLRTLEKTDARAFGVFLESLSAATRARYNPHERSAAEAERICANLESDPRIFFVETGPADDILSYAVVECSFPEDEIERYLGYGIVLDEARDCRIAPVVGDRHQGHGLGTRLMEYAIESLRGMEKRRIVLFGGTQVSNERAIKMYVRVGFVQVGEFMHKGKPSYDMTLLIR